MSHRTKLSLSLFIFCTACSTTPKSDTNAEPVATTGLPANTGVLTSKTAVTAAALGAAGGAATAAPSASGASGDATGKGVSYSGVQFDPALTSACSIPSNKAYFEYDSADVKGSQMGSLDAVATCLTTGPLKGKALEVVGHTDATGSDEFNKQLGYSRAQSVVNYLTSKGLDKTKVTVASKGKDDAAAKPGDANGMAYDRKVDVRLKKLRRRAPGVRVELTALARRQATLCRRSGNRKRW